MPRAASSKGVARTRAALEEDRPLEVDGWTDGMDQEYELVDVDSIKEHPDNYNVGDEAAIDESMQVNGWFGAVLVQRSTGYIIAHNHAYRVAKRRGALRVPVIWKDVDDVEALRILLADNETARRGHADEGRLRQILDDLGTLDGTGFPGFEELAGEEDAREAEEAEKESKERLEEGEEGEDFVTQYGVVVVCADEEEQQQVYELLRAEGRTVRPVTI